jgi:hypothetical protein
VSEQPSDDASRVSRNEDGSAIVQLRTPVTVDGETLSRVTIPALRGRHMMSAPNLTDTTTIGELITWATKVVEPRGAVEEMVPGDAVLVGNELLASLGKSRASHGVPGSPP